jgi:hypothetical protein
MHTTIRNLALLSFAIALSCFPQDRYQCGDQKGFVKSPTEGLLLEIDVPITVKSVRGAIVFMDNHDSGLKGALFEIRGPGTSEQIRSAVSDAKGRFAIPHVPEGTYAFKATKYAYLSVVGTVVVSKKADPQKRILIVMPPGV